MSRTARRFLTLASIPCWIAAIACSDAGPGPPRRALASEPVVRVSQGFFAEARLAEVRQRLETSRASLEPALRDLPGLLHYYAGIDPVSKSIVNVSVWESLEAAGRMDALQAMLAQRDLFAAAGVEFQPVRSYTGLWSIAP